MDEPDEKDVAFAEAVTSQDLLAPWAQLVRGRCLSAVPAGAFYPTGDVHSMGEAVRKKQVPHTLTLTNITDSTSATFVAIRHGVSDVWFMTNGRLVYSATSTFLDYTPPDQIHHMPNTRPINTQALNARVAGVKWPAPLPGDPHQGSSLGRLRDSFRTIRRAMAGN